MGLHTLQQIRPPADGSAPVTWADLMKLQDAVRGAYDPLIGLMDAATGDIAEAVGSLSGILTAMPPGTPFIWLSETVPDGWWPWDGRSVLRAAYPLLFAAIGTAFGTADAQHFNIPDQAGYFLRGWPNGSANDPDRASRTAAATGGATGDHVGTVEADAGQGHIHVITQGGQLIIVNGTPGSAVTSLSAIAAVDNGTHFVNGGPVTDGPHGTPRVASETRPLNLAVNFILRHD